MKLSCGNSKFLALSVAALISLSSQSFAQETKQVTHVEPID